MAGTRDDPIVAGTYTIHDTSTNQAIEFYDAKLSPPAGYFGRNYSQCVYPHGFHNLT